jgi:predicted dehydrogenase
MDIVRWGVLSTASIGTEKVIPGIQQAEGCEVVAIASRDPRRAARAAADLGIPRSHGSYEALLADPEVDAVYNPLPNHLHHEWSVAATRAGKPVLCEKPLGRTEAEARAIVDDCAPGVLLMEAFMYRFHPSWAAVRRLAAEEIGTLRAVHTRFSYFNDDPANIRNRPECGGGALLDIGCYAVNLSRMLFAAEPTAVESAVEIDPEVGVDVLSSGLLRFPTGHATFTCSTRGEPDQRVTLLGTDGRVEVEIPFNIPPDVPTSIFHTAGGDPPTDPHTETLTFPAADQYTLQAEAFAGALRSGGPAPIDPADAVANLAVLDEIRAHGGGSTGT